MERWVGCALELEEPLGRWQVLSKERHTACVKGWVEYMCGLGERSGVERAEEPSVQMGAEGASIGCWRLLDERLNPGFERPGEIAHTPREACCVKRAREYILEPEDPSDEMGGEGGGDEQWMSLDKRSVPGIEGGANALESREPYSAGRTLQQAIRNEEPLDEIEDEGRKVGQQVLTDERPAPGVERRVESALTRKLSSTSEYKLEPEKPSNEMGGEGGDNGRWTSPDKRPVVGVKGGAAALEPGEASWVEGLRYSLDCSRLSDEWRVFSEPPR
jgi:hypothetical protein